MQMSEDGSYVGKRVELFARSDLPSAANRRREAVTARLSRLADENHVDQVNIHTWEKKVPSDGSTLENLLYRTFEDWAADVGVELEPFFETRECYSWETGRRGAYLVLPALCLAVYRGEELQSVYPHAGDDETRTVMDGLCALASGRTESIEQRRENPIEMAD